MLYIFTTHLGTPGRPGRILAAGGIQRVIETEEIGVLVRTKFVQVTTANAGDDYHISERCIDLGIEWGWFPKAIVTPDEPDAGPWSFGNGVTRHKTTAEIEMRTVIHKTTLTEDEYLEQFGPTRSSDLVKERVHVRHEGWQQYQARWRPGTCPPFSHEVHLTSVILTRPLPPNAYQRLRHVVEEGEPPAFPERFDAPEDSSRLWSQLRPLTFKRHAMPIGV